VFWVSSEG